MILGVTLVAIAMLLDQIIHDRICFYNSAMLKTQLLFRNFRNYDVGTVI